MSERAHDITIPVHPDDRLLPRSDLRLKLRGGGLVAVLNIPLQGVKTLENLIATLKIWEPTIVTPPLEYHI